MSKYYDFIRQKCIEANPKLMELSMGCEIEIDYGRYKSIYRVVSFSDKSRTPKYIKLDGLTTFIPSSSCDGYFEGDIGYVGWTILGKCPTLADVLLAFGKLTVKPKYVYGYEDNQLLLCLPFTDKRRENVILYLSVPVRDWGEEALKFLALELGYNL